MAQITQQEQIPTMSEHIFAADLENFERSVIQDSSIRPVLVDFWAPWCSPCQQLMPVLHQLIEGLNGAVSLATVDTDEQQQLAMQFGVRSLPTLLLFKDGQVVEQITGLKPESEISALITPYITDNNGNQTDSELSEGHLRALKCIQEDEIGKAIEWLQNETAGPSQILLLKLYLQERQLQQAKELYATLDEELKNNDEVSLVKHIIDLLSIANQSSNDQIVAGIHHMIDVDANVAIQLLLELLPKIADEEEKALLKNGVILGFNLIQDKSQVSQLRRKLSSLVFN